MSEPAAPVPDDKDWTWTLRRPCPDCGFDAAGIEREDIAALTLIHTATLGAALGSPGASTRPEPTVWSALEYGAHVRDVCTLFAERLALMLREDDPLFANWDQDETALASRYWEQDPTVVSWELRAAAETVADAFAAVPVRDWQRSGRRSNGSQFTVETLGQYLLHDLAHHAWDVTRTG